MQQCVHARNVAATGALYALNRRFHAIACAVCAIATAVLAVVSLVHPLRAESLEVHDGISV